MANNNTPNRRDLLKLLSVLPAAAGVSSLVRALPKANNSSGHIILLVFDAWSARNVNLYGYKRETMPNLTKWADRAIVYRQHHTAGNYTVPGTASLLTGAHPWSHRAINLGGRINKEYQNRTLFNVLSPKMNTVGFSQNIYADQFLAQSGSGLNFHLPFGSFNLNDRVIYDAPFFTRDSINAYSAFEDGIVQHGKGIDGSLFMGPLVRLKATRDQAVLLPKYGEGYYNGLPESLESYTLAGVVDGMINTLESLSKPSFVYFHVFAPHDPYRPYARFFNAFKDDGLISPPKPDHPIIGNPVQLKRMQSEQLKYDAFIASWDQELARFFEFAQTSGLRDSSTIVITSDHGEMHERGVSGHSTQLLSEPLLHIPLIITTPGVTEQKNVSSLTSSVDILPTLTNLAGVAIPDWVEGPLLPLMGGQEDPARSVYALEAGSNSAFAPITEYSFAILKNDLKITRYQYKNYTGTEVFNFVKDPDENTDLHDQNDPEIATIKLELGKKIAEFGLAN